MSYKDHIQSTLYLVLVAILTALTTVGTIVVAIPFMGYGYLNFGDIFVMTSGMILGPGGGFLAGGLGSAMGDMLLGYYHFAPITFVVKGLEGLVVGICSRNSSLIGRLTKWDVVGLCLAASVMLTGYFIAESFLYGISYALAEITINVIQVGVGAIASSLIGPGMRAYLSDSMRPQLSSSQESMQRQM